MMKIEFRDTWSVQFVFSNSKVKSEMLGADDSNAFWWKDVTLNYTYDDQLFPGLWKNMSKLHTYIIKLSLQGNLTSLVTG